MQASDIGREKEEGMRAEKRVESTKHDTGLRAGGGDMIYLGRGKCVRGIVKQEMRRFYLKTMGCPQRVRES